MSVIRKFNLYLNRFAIAAFATLAGPLSAHAQALVPVPYDQLRKQMSGTVTFETLPPQPEPGHILNQVMRSGSVQLGEHFIGQTVLKRQTRDGGRFDALSSFSSRSLRIAPGETGQNLALAWHRGFGSMALFPLGPASASRIEGRGEGSIAVLFDEDQPGIGFLLHAAYRRMLGGGPAARGAVTVTAYARDGKRIGRIAILPGEGVQRLAWRRAGSARDIAGFTVENVDPGGIALDDLLFARDIPLG